MAGGGHLAKALSALERPVEGISIRDATPEASLATPLISALPRQGSLAFNQTPEVNHIEWRCGDLRCGDLYRVEISTRYGSLRVSG